MTPRRTATRQRAESEHVVCAKTRPAYARPFAKPQPKTHTKEFPMSTALHDLASAAFVASGLNPDTQTTSPTGSAIDMISADGPCFAIQQVGAFSADTTS